MRVINFLRIIVKQSTRDAYFVHISQWLWRTVAVWYLSYVIDVMNMLYVMQCNEYCHSVS